MDIISVILTSLLSVAALFIIAKIMGHKQLSQLDFFDYISGITIGSIAAELATDIESPTKPLIALVIYGLVSVTLSFIAHKIPKARKYINGSPTIIMNDGKIYRKNMKQAKLDLSEFLLLCREQGYFNLKDIKTAVFETNGKLSILPVSAKRPATPYDMSLNVELEHIYTELIMDGRILRENLNRMKLDEDWLTLQIKSQGYEGAKDIFLGVCDNQKNLTLYGFN